MHESTLADRGCEICCCAAVHGCLLHPFPGAVLAGAFFVRLCVEKITEHVKLHLPESLLRDVQDAAMKDDRKVSEYVRHVLSLHLYGTKGSHQQPDDNGTMCPGEGRGHA